jgi:hypothetical protein
MAAARIPFIVVENCAEESSDSNDSGRISPIYSTQSNRNNPLKKETIKVPRTPVERDIAI